MIAYVDSSVILRKVFGQPDKLAEWDSIGTAMTSVLARVECLRAVDRSRLRAELDDSEIAARRGSIYRLLDNAEVVEVSRSILARASQPYATVLGTLDAIHLATALRLRERRNLDLVMATHDAALARAARAHGMEVIGV